MALLATKLYIPSARTGVLSRSRLAEPSDLGPILVSVPTNCRETSLQITWALTHEIPGDWIYHFYYQRMSRLVILASGLS